MITVYGAAVRAGVQAPAFPSMFLAGAPQRPPRATLRIRSGRPMPLLIAGAHCPICDGQFMATPAAVELLCLTAHGFSAHAIGRRLNTGAAAVADDLQALTVQLAAANAVQAVDIAVRAGLLPGPARRPGGGGMWPPRGRGGEHWPGRRGSAQPLSLEGGGRPPPPGPRAWTT
ncbi:hypothetical protein ACFV6I_13400, partial [Kitasatospora sp. NPDC059803]